MQGDALNPHPTANHLKPTGTMFFIHRGKCCEQQLLFG